MKREYSVAYDDEPVMGGGHRRHHLGSWPTEAEAREALTIVEFRSLNAPKNDLCIEFREVSNWVRLP